MANQKMATLIEEIENTANFYNYVHEMKKERGEFATKKAEAASLHQVGGMFSLLSTAKTAAKSTNNAGDLVAALKRDVQNKETLHERDRTQRRSDGNPHAYQTKREEYARAAFIKGASLVLYVAEERAEEAAREEERQPLHQLTMPALRAVYYQNPALQAELRATVIANIEKDIAAAIDPVRGVVEHCEINEHCLPHIRFSKKVQPEEILEALDHLHGVQEEINFIEPYEHGTELLEEAAAAVRVLQLEDADGTPAPETEQRAAEALGELTSELERTFRNWYLEEDTPEEYRCEAFARDHAGEPEAPYANYTIRPWSFELERPAAALEV